MESSCELQSDYDALCSPACFSREVASLCMRHCSVIVYGHGDHDDLTSSHLPPVYHWQSRYRRTAGNKRIRSCARCGTQPNISQHELTTAMQHLSHSSRRHQSISEVLDVRTGKGSSRCIELNHMLHRLCGPPSIHLSFNLAAVLPRRST